MENKICQSCSMPIESEEIFGTNADGSKNYDYCIYCFKDGQFIDDVNLQEYIEMSIPYYEQAGMSSAEEMRKYCENVLPTLKRWQCTCTQDCASGYNPNCECTCSECHCKEK